MIDLHTHTTFSDGTWTIEEMLSNAEKAGISTLAITDHDTAMPHIKLKEIDTKSYFSGRIIVGGEFNAFFDNIKDEWNIREGFFRSCTCNPNFVLYRDFSKQYPNALEVSKQIRKARR